MSYTPAKAGGDADGPCRGVALLHCVLMAGAEVLCGLVCAFAVYFPITDGDIWWHLASGREMAVRRGFLMTDPFAYTPTYAWVNLHWLFQLGAYALHYVGGVRGLVIAKCLLFGIACGIMVWVFGRPAQGKMLVALTTACGGCGVRYLVLARPTVVTLVYLALVFALLEAFCRSGRRAWLWLLLPLQVAWVNTQGLFVLGPVVVALYAVGTALAMWPKRRGANVPLPFSAMHRHVPFALTATLVAMLLCCFMNPYGVDAFRLPLRLYARIEPSLRTVFSHNIAENVPTLALLNTSNPQYAQVAIAVAVLATGAMLTAWRRVRIEHALMLAAFLYLGFTAERNVLLLVFVVVPLAAGYAADTWAGVESSGYRRVVGVTAMAALGVLLISELRTHARVVRLYPQHSAVSPMRFPVEAVAYLRQHHVPGQIFNADRYGGYLIWELYPPRQVFIDGRFALRTPEFFTEYLRAYDQPASFDTLAARYGITHALLQTAFFDRYLPLARRLYHDPNWRLVFTDGTSALFVVDSLAPTAGVNLSDPLVRMEVESRLGDIWRDDPWIHAEAVARFRRFARLMTAPALSTPLSAVQWSTDSTSARGGG